MIVAIDGPAGSGKGTIASILSKRCNLVNIDTGATYRCLALKVLQNNLTLENKEEIIALSKDINIELAVDGKVYLDNIDVTKEIRSKEVTEIVSPISSIVEVRKNLVDLQRRIASNYDVVMEGRDITTVVLPHANVKIYLDASLDERVKRRYKECQEKGINMSYEEIKENITSRDYNDTHKEVGALKRTDDQIYVDTTHMTIEEVADTILKIIERADK